jgi:hypothetical protein
MVDRDLEHYTELMYAERQEMTASNVYYVAILKPLRADKFRNELLYLAPLKDQKSWSLSIHRGRAFRFDFEAYARTAIQGYCRDWKGDVEDFQVIKVTEERIIKF